MENPIGEKGMTASAYLVMSGKIIRVSAGALGAALLSLRLKRAWVERDLDSRAFSVTKAGAAALKRLFDCHPSISKNN